jgi:NAD(P)-dependent dehydrogenase (short-subunit alcohol dehydrogenase family)
MSDLFNLCGKIAVITGGGGVLGGAIAQGLAQAGAKCAITSSTLARGQAAAAKLAGTGADVKGFGLDVLAPGAVETFCDEIYAAYGRVDILVNCVGGNVKEATTSGELTFFDLSTEAIRKVLDLNFTCGVVTPCQVFGKRMKDNANGASIINVSSMAAATPLTRIAGYAAAKAAVNNFTQWLAVHFAQEYTAKLRVNAIAPGFFLTEQNRYLLTDEHTGAPTERGNKIITHTPMAQFGAGSDLVGAAIWLASDASRFVTGTILPIDGGFSAYSGV